MCVVLCAALCANAAVDGDDNEKRSNGGARVAAVTTTGESRSTGSSKDEKEETKVPYVDASPFLEV